MEGSQENPISAVRYVEVSADEAGQRIDNYLARVLKGLPKSRIYRSLRRGEVRVNAGRVKPQYRLQSGDRLRIPPLRLRERHGQGPGRGKHCAFSERVIFEDGRLLVVDKPSGLAVHGGSGIAMGAIEALRAERPGAPYLELVHRLDRATSGCLMIAKKRSALRALHQLLRDGNVEKRYLALTLGVWQGGERLVSAGLATHGRRGGERVVSVDNEGKPSATRFAPVQRFADATLVDVTTLTGRTHQIRVHAAHIGHPLAGDERYGDAVRDAGIRARGLRRLFLHAHSISFDWPDGSGEVHVSAPLPADLRRVIDSLESSRA